MRACVGYHDPAVGQPECVAHLVKLKVLAARDGSDRDGRLLAHLPTETRAGLRAGVFDDQDAGAVFGLG